MTLVSALDVLPKEWLCWKDRDLLDNIIEVLLWILVSTFILFVCLFCPRSIWFCWQTPVIQYHWTFPWHSSASLDVLLKVWLCWVAGAWWWGWPGE